MKIRAFEEDDRDDLIFMVLQAKDALGRKPKINEDLLDITWTGATNFGSRWMKTAG